MSLQNREDGWTQDNPLGVDTEDGGKGFANPLGEIAKGAPPFPSPERRDGITRKRAPDSVSLSPDLAESAPGDPGVVSPRSKKKKRKNPMASKKPVGGLLEALPCVDHARLPFSRAIPLFYVPARHEQAL